MSDSEEFLLILLAIVNFVWGILCGILFFKIWAMTNDVKKLTSYVQQLTTKVCGEIKEPEKAKPACRDFNKGDKVFVVASGKEAQVEKCEGNSYLCYAEWLKGFKWFDASELKRTPL